MSANEIKAGGFTVPFQSPVRPADDWDARAAVPDPRAAMDDLRRAEAGYCIDVDEESQTECGKPTVFGELYCDWDRQRHEEAQEETSLDSLRAEIAGMGPVPPDPPKAARPAPVNRYEAALRQLMVHIDYSQSREMEGSEGEPDQFPDLARMFARLMGEN